MIFASFAAAFAMAAVLLAAAVAKMHDFEPATATIRSLGVPQRLARPLAVSIAATEIAVGLAILFRPDSSITQLGIVALALTFVLAGALALRSDEAIPCNCFGRSGKLGWRQIAAFVPWTAGALLLRIMFREAPPREIAAALFAAIALGIAAFRAVQVWKARLEARADRLSAQEMLAWLPSR